MLPFNLNTIPTEGLGDEIVTVREAISQVKQIRIDLTYPSSVRLQPMWRQFTERVDRGTEYNIDTRGGGLILFVTKKGLKKERRI